MDLPFRYQPLCSAPGCGRPALYKVAAAWSNGGFAELKNYGLACEQHRAEQLARARDSRRGLHPAEGETLGEVGLYQFLPGVRDVERTRLPDEGLAGRG